MQNWKVYHRKDRPTYKSPAPLDKASPKGNMMGWYMLLGKIMWNVLL